MVASHGGGPRAAAPGRPSQHETFGRRRPTYAATMATRALEIEAARRSFLTSGRIAVPAGTVRSCVLTSWERSHDHDVDPDRVSARFLGHPATTAASTRCADEVFATTDVGSASLLLVDASGVVRVRRDGDRTLASLLDGLLLVPGYGYGERAVGTTAAAVALHEGAPVTVTGPEHYHAQLGCLATAAAPVAGPDGEPCGAVAVVDHAGAASDLQLTVATLLAERIAERIAGDPHRISVALLDRVATATGDWVLAAAGDTVVTNGPCRRLGAEDQRTLTDVALARLALADFGSAHVDLPSGTCAEVVVEPVTLAGTLVGCVLSGAPAGVVRELAPPESVRRQGSHVAPLGRRDYARDLHGDRGRAHAEARIRANRELLSPYLRARAEVAASVRQSRNHLLIGEPGVGKRTLLVDSFRTAHPTGRVAVVDGSSFGSEPAGPGARQPDLLPRRDGRPHLVLLRAMNELGPVGARRLDEALRPLVALPDGPLVVGCVDTPAVDATRPYGLLLRHFHEVTRVPALRYRADEIGDIALAVLRRIGGGRSLRLSLQVIRVLESYAWPGNIAELEDVLRYVVARKPVGEIQPPDLPTLCFTGRTRRLSMLESAQCDAIIQALYESRGNRYKAAAMLGIARSSLYRKIDAFGISYIA